MYRRILLLPRVNPLEWVIIALFVVVVGYNDWGCSEYCQWCGLRQYRGATTFLGAPIRQERKQLSSEYFRLYQIAHGPSCVHKWRITSRSWSHGIGGILGAGVGCSESPGILHRKSYYLKALDLETPGQIAAGLRRFQNPDGSIKR